MLFFWGIAAAVGQMYHAPTIGDASEMARVMREECCQFIKYDAVACADCQALDLTWALLPETYPGVATWRVECGVSRDLCVEAGGRGQPAFARVLHSGELEWYHGGRDIDSLMRWVQGALPGINDGFHVHRAFDHIYKAGMWSDGNSPGSGTGSTAAGNAGYLSLLDWIMQQQIRSIVEVGCGDFELMQHAKLQKGVTYHGYDVSTEAIRRAQRHARSGVRFSVSLPNQTYERADLVIIKDVLQHLPMADVALILSQLPKYRAAIIVNDVLPGAPNADTDHRGRPMMPGNYRPLDVQRPPFGVVCSKVVAAHSGMRSVVKGAIKTTCIALSGN